MEMQNLEKKPTVNNANGQVNEVTVNNNNTSQSEDEQNEKRDILLNEKFWPWGKRTPTGREYAAGGTGFTSVILSIVAAATARIPIGKIFVYISGVINLFTAPRVVYNQTELTKLDTFREVLNEIRKEVDRFRAENDKLHLTVDELEENVDRLNELESGLSAIAEQQGQNVTSLMGLVGENKKIARELRKVLKARALQNLVTLIMESDTNFDFNLEDREVDRLVLGMSIMEEIDLDETRFRSMIKASNGSIDAVLELMKSLVLDDEDEEEELDGKSVRSMRSARSVRSQGTAASKSSIKVKQGKDYLEYKRSVVRPQQT